ENGLPQGNLHLSRGSLGCLRFSVEPCIFDTQAVSFLTKDRIDRIERRFDFRSTASQDVCNLFRLVTFIVVPDKNVSLGFGPASISKMASSTLCRNSTCPK